MSVVLVLPILAQPDLGMSLMVFTIGFVMMFVAGVRMLYLGGLVLTGHSGGLHPYRGLPLPVSAPGRLSGPLEIPAMARASRSCTASWPLVRGAQWAPGWANPSKSCFTCPSRTRISSSACWARNSASWGVALVLSLFLLLVWRGIKTALGARDLFGTYLAMGATLIIGLQAFVNAGVVMGALPTTGLTLPFISSGGSSMVTNFICVGILLSVSAHKGRKA